MPVFAQALLEKFKLPISIFLIGLSFFGIGLFLKKVNSSNDNLVYSDNSESTTVPSSGKIIAEVSGAIQKPGVYEFSGEPRVNDLIEIGGGLTTNANLEFVSKNINKAAKIYDGQKLYIPEKSDVAVEVMEDTQKYTNQTVLGSSNSIVNINKASISDLESLPKIGQVYAQKIIEQRPYSSIEELKNKKIIPEKTYDSIKNLITAN